MKTILLVLTMTILGIVAHAQTTSLVVKTQIYCSHCAECGSCAPLIQKQVLSTVKGTQSVELDVSAMTITVVYDAKLATPDAIRTAISKAGYDADDVKANKSAYAALDGCCKKK